MHVEIYYIIYIYTILILPLTFFCVPRETDVLAGTAVLAGVDITRYDGFQHHSLRNENENVSVCAEGDLVPLLITCEYSNVYCLRVASTYILHTYLIYLTVIRQTLG